MQDNEACFVFHLPASARLAQSAERKALNLVVVGSSPTVGAMVQRLGPQEKQYPPKQARNTIYAHH